VGRSKPDSASPGQPFHSQGETFPNGPEKDALLHGLRSEQLILKTTQDSQKVFSYLDSDA